MTSRESASKKTICCFARVRDKAFFDSHDFYRVDVQILRQLGHEVHLTNSVQELLRVKCDLYFAWWFGYGIFPALIGFIRRRPVVVSGVLHTLNCQGLSGWPSIKRLVMKLTMKLADCSIVCSRGEFERLDGFRPRRCEIVPLTIDSGVYGFSPKARQKFILMVTQLNIENVERKMVLPAIAAFAQFHARHADFKLVICGVIDNAIETVRESVRQHGLKHSVTFTGRVSLDEKISLFQTAWAYLQPTSCEGFGLAIGEALACGTPVVTSPEVCVAETYGDSVQYGESPTALAHALSRLAEDEGFYRTMQTRGRLHVQQYSLANRCARFQAILEHVCP